MLGNVEIINILHLASQFFIKIHMVMSIVIKD